MKRTKILLQQVTQGLLVLTLFFSVQTVTYAQHSHFVESGKIDYEKKVNMFAKMKARLTDDNVIMKKLYEDYRENQPQFQTSKSTLTFTIKESLYETIEVGKPNSYFFSSEPWNIVNNTILTDYTKDSLSAVKVIFEEDFILKDKRPTITWKFTNEKREIAGYQCNRVNGLIADSIYVVAFYSQEIIPSGGPESFSGLPGMILGIALPHENVTWFATKVELVKPVIKPLSIPKKAKHVNREELQEFLQKNMKSWGSGGDDALKAFLL